MPPRRPALLAEAGARVAADINDPPLKAARSGNVSDWHAHPEGDEAFLPSMAASPPTFATAA